MLDDIGKGFNPDQPRVPAGSPEGGRWTDGGGNDVATPVLDRIAARDAKKEEIRKEMQRVAKELGADLWFGGNGQHIVSAKFEKYNEYGGGWDALRYFIFQQNGDLIVDHSSMYVTPGYRDRGTAKKFLSSMMDAYEQLGVDKITLETMQVGSYAWARFGFKPDMADSDQRDSMREAAHIAAQRLAKMAGRIPAEVVKVASTAIRNKDIWAISDLRYDINGSSLGYHLLESTDWSGSLDLHDPDAVARFNAYTGRTTTKSAKGEWGSRRRRRYSPRYNPSQPRAPRGTPIGGQWVSTSYVGPTGQLVTDNYKLSSAAGGLLEDDRWVWDRDLLSAADGLRPAGMSLNARVEDSGGAATANALLAEYGLTAKAFDTSEGNIVVVREQDLGRDDLPDFIAAATKHTSGVGASWDLSADEHRLIGRWLDYDPAGTEEFLRYMGKAYNPNQPREPKGVPTGGRWVGGDGSEEDQRRERFRSWRREMKRLAEEVGAKVTFYDHGGYDYLQVDFDHKDWYASRTFKVRKELGGVYDEDGFIIVTHDNFFVNGLTQSKGASKKFLAASMDAYEKLGVSRINLETVQVGSYAWARFGFKPNYSHRDWSESREIIYNRIEAAHQNGWIPDGVRKVAVTAMRQNDIWALSDLRYDLQGKPLGYHLLESTGWDGYLDLNDPAAMQRFNAYTGRAQKAYNPDHMLREPIKKAGFDPSQPRRPAGSRGGGQWTRGAGSAPAPSPIADGGKAGGEAMRNYTKMVSEFMNTPHFKWYFANGQVYEVDGETFIGGTPQQCYKNTFQATNSFYGDDDLTYVEGFVSVHGVPIHHAWAVTKDGKVRDYTISKSRSNGIQGYFGVPIKKSAVMEAARRTKIYGVTAGHANWEWILSDDIVER